MGMLFDDLPQFFGVVVEFVEVDVSVCEVCRCFVDGIGKYEVVFRIRGDVFRGGVDEVDVAVLVGGGEPFDGLVFCEGAVVCIEFIEVFAIKEGGGRRGEVVFVEEVIEACDIWRVGAGRRVGFPFSRFRFLVDGDAIEGAVAVFEVILVCFVAVVCYAEYGVIGVAVIAKERCEEDVGMLGRLYVDEFFDDGIVVVDGVVVAAAVDDGRDEDAVVEVVSAVIVVMMRRMIVRSVDGRSVMGASVMRRTDAIAVRRSVVGSHTVVAVWRSVVGSHIGSAVRSVFVETVTFRRMIAVRLHIGSAVRSVFVEAVTSRGLIAVRFHIGTLCRSLLRLHLGSCLRSLLWFHLGSCLRSLLRLHLGSCLRSLLRFHLRSRLRSLLWFYRSRRSFGRLSLFWHGTCLGALFYLCGSW